MIEENVRQEQMAFAGEDPRSRSSLIPMLISGLVLILVAMIAVLAFS